MVIERRTSKYKWEEHNLSQQKDQVDLTKSFLNISTEAPRPKMEARKKKRVISMSGSKK